MDPFAYMFKNTESDSPVYNWRIDPVRCFFEVNFVEENFQEAVLSQPIS